MNVSQLSSAIRPARREDADGIAAVLQELWCQDLEIDVFHAHLTDECCAVWVATENGEVVGFLSAFLTQRDNVRRWEVDLLAVRHTSQRKGLGGKLVEATREDAVDCTADLMRASIRVDNLPSQKTFQRAGYTTDGDVYKLLLWEPRLAEVDNTDQQISTLLPVDALTYRGMWIENFPLHEDAQQEQRCCITAACHLAAVQNRLNTGTFILVEREHLLAKDLQASAEMHGEYQRWQRR